MVRPFFRLENWRLVSDFMLDTLAGIDQPLSLEEKTEGKICKSVRL